MDKFWLANIDGRIGIVPGDSEDQAILNSLMEYVSTCEVEEIDINDKEHIKQIHWILGSGGRVPKQIKNQLENK